MVNVGQSDMLRGIGEDDAARLVALGSRPRLEPGQLLFDLGAEANDVYLIERGRIALTLPMKVGERHEDVLVEERTVGQVVGWSGLIPPHRFTLKAAALVTTDLVALPRPALESFFAANPAVGYVVSRNLASVVGHRLQVFQAMWLREIQRFVEMRAS